MGNGANELEGILLARDKEAWESVVPEYLELGCRNAFVLPLPQEASTAPIVGERTSVVQKNAYMCI